MGAVHAAADQRPRNRVIDALFPPWTPAINWPLFFVAVALAVLAASLTALIKSTPFLQIDADVERFIQSINWGPLESTFPFFSWIGGPGATYLLAVTFVLVLIFNYRAWLLAIAALAGGALYFVIVNVANRPRPTSAQVLHVTEHPGASSFPSGHVIFITLSVAVIMLCIGYRYLPRRARPIGWVVAAAIVGLAGISRIYVGAHWPTDVLGSLLIAGAWLCFVTSIRWISDRAVSRRSA